MIRCSQCNTQQLNGTIFCTECGASLIDGGPRRETTTALNQQNDGMPGVVEQSAPVLVPEPPSTDIQSISLVVINSGRRINLEAGEDLLIGRKDNQRGIFPDVDLGLDGGYDAGVSRRHAIIMPNRQGYLLEDLASANGTFVNGRRLTPQSPTPIHHGDELKFGTLILRFEVS